MKHTRVPSPLPYLLEVEDFRARNSVYNGQKLFPPVLMAIGSGRTSPLAVAQWVEDEREWLLSTGLGSRAGGEGLPAQATIYRFFRALENNVSALEGALQKWARAVLRARGYEREPVINVDGKHLKSSAK